MKSLKQPYFEELVKTQVPCIMRYYVKVTYVPFHLMACYKAKHDATLRNALVVSTSQARKEHVCLRYFVGLSKKVMTVSVSN